MGKTNTKHTDNIFHKTIYAKNLASNLLIYYAMLYLMYLMHLPIENFNWTTCKNTLRIWL